MNKKTEEKKQEGSCETKITEEKLKVIRGNQKKSTTYCNQMKLVTDKLTNFFNGQDVLHLRLI